MAARPNIVCGVEITRDGISIAQYSASDNTVMNSSIVVNPAEDVDPSADFVSSIKPEFTKLASGMKCAGQPAGVAVPANYAVVKKLMLDADEENVPETIGWELGQHIVGDIDDYAFDYEPLPGGDGGVQRYLAAAYRRAPVDKLLSLLKKARMAPKVVDIDIFALVAAFEANYHERLGSVAALIHGGSDSSRVILTSGGSFIDYDVVEHRGGHTPADEYALQLREAVQRLASGEQAAGAIFVTGSLFSDTEFCEAVCSRLGNASVLDPFRLVRLTAPIPPADVIKCVPHLAVAVGLALRCAAEAEA
jgi:Tfp pilus assembly PilM family ATPase